MASGANNTSKSLELKVGYHNPERNFRLYLLHHNIGGLDEASLSTTAIGGSLTPKINERLRWNLGVYVGVSELHTERVKWTADTKQYTGGSLGLDTGILYELNAHGEIEFGLRYMKDIFRTTLVNRANVKLGKLDIDLHHFGVLIGYNYKF